MASIHSIFASIQGEGPKVGECHLFIRFAACNLRCPYCDTPEAMMPVRFAKIIHRETETRKKNPIAIDDLVEICRSYLSVHKISTISLTGGEPLFYADYIVQFLEALGQMKPGILLETNSTMIEELGKVLPFIDYVSADWKSLVTGVEEVDEARTLNFLKAATGFAQTWLKIPVNEDVTPAYINRTVKAVMKEAPDISEIILQPITGIDNRPVMNEFLLFDLHQAALSLTPKVRVIPQIHKFLGLK